MNDDMQIEIRLWNYIDGNVDAAEKKEIEQLLQQDDAWKDLYRQLTAVHEGMQTDIELDEPSMRFTKNVMEEISKLKIAPATKNYLNKKIINAIAIFFLGLLAVMLVYGLTRVDVSNSATNNFSFDISVFDLSKYFTPATLNILLAFYVIMGLVLVDKIIAKKNYTSKR